MWDLGIISSVQQLLSLYEFLVIHIPIREKDDQVYGIGRSSFSSRNHSYLKIPRLGMPNRPRIKIDTLVRRFLQVLKEEHIVA
jgi:hypothetical protein